MKKGENSWKPKQSSTDRSWVVLVRRSCKTREAFRCSCVYFATQYNVHYDNRQAGHLLPFAWKDARPPLFFPTTKWRKKSLNCVTVHFLAIWRYLWSMGGNKRQKARDSCSTALQICHRHQGVFIEKCQRVSTVGRYEVRRRKTTVLHTSDNHHHGTRGLNPISHPDFALSLHLAESFSNRVPLKAGPPPWGYFSHLWS